MIFDLKSLSDTDCLISCGTKLQIFDPKWDKKEKGSKIILLVSIVPCPKCYLTQVLNVKQINTCNNGMIMLTTIKVSCTKE